MQDSLTRLKIPFITWLGCLILFFVPIIVNDENQVTSNFDFIFILIMFAVGSASFLLLFYRFVKLLFKEKDFRNKVGQYTLYAFLICIFIWIVFSSNSSSPNFNSTHYDEFEYDDYVITSDNWECTDDCSGHEAGYEWAADKGITDPDDCGGNSNSFIEGCEAFANEY